MIETGRASIASSIRSVMVADVDRSWLDSVMDDVAMQLGDDDGAGVGGGAGSASRWRRA